MIRTFECADTEALYRGTRVAKFVNIEKVAMRKLAMLNRAQTLNDLRIPPRNCLESLAANRVGQYSVRINDRYRVCFRFQCADAYDVEIVDYH